MEGGVIKADKVEFTECWNTIWKTPYIMRLALSAGIGGLLFGYDTGTFLLTTSYECICPVAKYVHNWLLLLGCRGYFWGLALHQR